MIKNIFFAIGMMVPALANAGFNDFKSVGECVEEAPASKYGFELTSNFPAKPLHHMSLASIQDHGDKKAHLAAKLTTGGNDYMLTSYPARMVGGKEVWSKSFDAKGSGEFTADDGTQITMVKHSKLRNEYNDSAMVFDPEAATMRTFDTTVTFSDGGLPQLVKMSCRVNYEQYAKLDGSEDLSNSLRILSQKQEHHLNLWKEANDAVQCKDVKKDVCLTTTKKTGGQESVD